MSAGGALVLAPKGQDQAATQSLPIERKASGAMPKDLRSRARGGRLASTAAATAAALPNTVTAFPRVANSLVLRSALMVVVLVWTGEIAGRFS